nr:hypothetical protein [Planctomycetota bacterium]
MGASAVLSATAYGQHLGLVLGSAQRAAPDVFANDERACFDGYGRLSTAGRDLVARMVQRRRPVPTAGLAVSDDLLREAQASGWLEAATAEPGPQQEWWPGAAAPSTKFATTIVATTPARRLTRAALVIAFADPAAELAIFPRIALGQIAPSSGSPLAGALAGGHPEATCAFVDRAALDALLEAWDARNAGPDVLALARALDQVSSQAGAPLPLIGQQLTALHHWSHLLFDCLSLALPEERRAMVVRALRRAPLSAHLARRVWSEVHRRQ